MTNRVFWICKDMGLYSDVPVESFVDCCWLVWGSLGY